MMKHVSLQVTRLLTKSARQRGEQERNYTLLQNAFHRPEAGPRNVAKPVYDQIVEYYRQYDDSIYGSPYTSIVGPSGIGKSFVMQSIASRVRGNHHDHKSCHRVMINDRVIRGPNVIRFDRYTYLGKVDRVA